MSVNMKEKAVMSSDGVHSLAGRVYVPDGEIKGLFQVVHGMEEHIERYDSFMREMANDGYIVFGYDHLGHGKTCGDKIDLGFIAHEKGYEKLVDDVAVFAKAVKKEYGQDLPFVLMGHSMGSFIVRLSAAKYEIQDKLIIMGTGGPNPASAAGGAVIGIIKAFKGERYVSDFVENVAFGSYEKRFQNEGKKAWLTKNADVRTAYLSDPYCAYRFTVSAMGDLVKLQRECNKKSWAAKMKGRRILLVSGKDDPVGDYGRGVQKVYEMLLSGGADVSVKIYDGCRHEILNDTCRDEVIADIREFLK